MSTPIDVDTLIEDIAEALFFHENPDPGISWDETRAFPPLRGQYMDAATAILPIVESWTQAAQEKAWDVGAETAWERSTVEVNGQHYHWRSSGEPKNPYHEAGDSDGHR